MTPPEKEEEAKIGATPPIEKQSTRSIFQNTNSQEKLNPSVSGNESTTGTPPSEPSDVPINSPPDSTVSKYFTTKTKNMYTHVPPKLGGKNTKSRKKGQKVISKAKTQGNSEHNNEFSWFR